MIILALEMQSYLWNGKYLTPSQLFHYIEDTQHSEFKQRPELSFTIYAFF